MTERHITVSRTARYHVLGDPAAARTLWVVLHGYGQLARFFLNKFTALAPERLIVAPEALNRFYLDDAHQRVGATWMTREDRENEVHDQCVYLDALVSEVLRGQRPMPVHVLGFSQGVATACRWSLRGRTRIDHLVLWAGSLPVEPTDAELRQGWAHTRVDLVLGTQDPYAGDKEIEGYAARLERAGVAHTVHRFTGGHTLDQVLLTRLMA
jgi:predicted esterase